MDIFETNKLYSVIKNNYFYLQTKHIRYCLSELNDSSSTKLPMALASPGS